MPDVLPRPAADVRPAPRRARGGTPRLAADLVVPRSAVQPAQLPRQLPRLGDARPLGQARGLRRGLQAGRLPRATERVQLAAPASMRRMPKCSARSARGGWSSRSATRAGSAASELEAMLAGLFDGRHNGRDRHRLPPLRRRPNRHPQSARGEGRPGEPPAEHRVPVRRGRQAAGRGGRRPGRRGANRRPRGRVESTYRRPREPAPCASPVRSPCPSSPSPWSRPSAGPRPPAARETPTPASISPA